MYFIAPRLFDHALMIPRIKNTGFPMFLPHRSLLTIAAQTITAQRLAVPTLAVLGVAFVSLATATIASATDPSEYLGRAGGQHRLLSSDMPPGFIGTARLRGRGPGPVVGYYQPVAFYGPKGTEFALAADNAFHQSEVDLQAGLMIGSVYRFKITNIPRLEGAEVYPTIEVIDRTYPPPGLATRYPITVQIGEDDLRSAIAGQLVTRVIYLEDPQSSIPLEQTQASDSPMDIAEYQDALEVADRFGRPVAILRMGSLAPPSSYELMPAFFFGSPSWAPIVKNDTKPAAPGYLPSDPYSQP